VLNETFFNEFTIRVPGDAARVIEGLAQKGVLGGVPFARLDPAGQRDLIIVAATETNTDDDRRAYAEALTEVLAC
jgi:glycine dehydrogenase subunit 1